MDRPWVKARLAGRLNVVDAEFLDIADALNDLRVFQLSAKAYELSVEIMHLRRDLLELPPQSGAPPALEEDFQRMEEDVPF